MRLSIFVLVLLAGVSFNADAQHWFNKAVVPEKQIKWIEETKAALKKIKPDNSLDTAQFYHLDFTDSIGLAIYVADKALIRTTGKGWIYVMAHSEHTDKAIGDIALAIDNKRRMYKSESHICGGVVVFQASHFKELEKTEDFFKYFTNNAGGKGRWERIK